MENNIEYQIFIGCTDPQSNSEEINEDELREMVVSFFKRKQIDFSLYSVKGIVYILLVSLGNLVGAVAFHTVKKAVLK